MGMIEGKVESIDAAGNLVTDIAVERLRGVPTDERLTILCDEHETRGLFSPGHSEPEMTLLALLATSGKLEITIVGDSASLMLGIRPGEKVVVKW